MRVSKEKLTELLVALGVDTAAGWSAADAQKRVNDGAGIARYPDPPESRPSDPALAKLFDEIAASQAAGTPVEVVEDEPAKAPKPAAKKPVAKKSGKKPAAAKPKAAGTKAAPVRAASGAERSRPKLPAGATFAQKRAFWAKHPMPITDRGPGIIRTLYKELKVAGDKKKGVTKEYLLRVLKAQFPKRKPAKMTTYINNMVPTRFRLVYGIHVWKQRGPDGVTTYMIVGNGKQPQPGPKKVNKRLAAAS